MKNNQKHVIHKVFLEVNTTNKEKAFSIKDDISSFLSMEVFPEIELLFEKLEQDLPDFAVQIDQLTLDITTKNLELNQELKQNLIQAVKTQIKESITASSTSEQDKKSKPKFLNKENHQLETVLYFFQHGTSPWWHGETSLTALLDEKQLAILCAQPSFKTKLSKILPLPKVQERLINQLSSIALLIITELFIPEQEKGDHFHNDINKQLHPLSSEEKKQFWLAFFTKIITQKEITTTILLEEIDKPQQKNKANNLLKNATIQPSITSDPISMENQHTTEKQTKKSANTKKALKNTNTESDFSTENNATTPTKTETTPTITNQTDFITTDTIQELEQGIHLKNAGLILIHPFLPHLFKHCELIDSNKKIIQPELAVHILHYLATGKTEQAESDLIFEKFLCNIPLQHSIKRHITLSEAHKEHTKKLLNATRQNWSSMKKSSFALLQNEFLQRPGKLEFQKADAILTIERKTQDILLNKLSWGISMVRLPWRKGFIYVHWN